MPKYHLINKAPFVGSRSNRFWEDLKKFRELKSHSTIMSPQIFN